ncbi:MAG TPA: 4Fe-4S binding protein [Ignavibacteria bacterium]|nr:4Fe-4S binding protein [Ignavibacteria bacterium]
MLKGISKYFSEIYHAVRSLLTGMKITGYYFFHPKEIVTQQYPENRDTLKMFDQFRGEVVLIHDENNEHKCTGCSACELACPNGTIEIISDKVLDPETGKQKKVIDKFVYHLQMCTFCNLCIPACPTDAIKMAQTYEHAVFDRSELTKVLNRPGSKIMAGIKE